MKNAFQKPSSTPIRSHPINSPSFIPKRIGELLLEANLLTPAQVQVALYDQQQFSTMRFGEILVFRGWLSEQTTEFFAEQWCNICAQDERQSLGEYLCAAGLMDQKCIEKIIEEQYRNGYRFGANAVLLGFIEQKTLDYFLENLFPEKKSEAHYVFNGKQRIMHPQDQVFQEIAGHGGLDPLNIKEKTPSNQSNKQTPSSDNEISWVG